MEEIKKSLELRMKTQKEALVIKSRQLAKQLIRIANRLDKKEWLEELGLICDLGEVQFQGPLIDVYCGTLRAYHKIYKEIVEMEEKENEAFSRNERS
jgi:hypothetical protein